MSIFILTQPTAIKVRMILKAVDNFNDAVDVTSQHLVAVDVFLQHHFVVVLVNHLLLGCAKRVSAALDTVNTGREVVAGVGWVLLHFEGNI